MKNIKITIAVIAAFSIIFILFIVVSFWLNSNSPSYDEVRLESGYISRDFSKTKEESLSDDQDLGQSQQRDEKYEFFANRVYELKYFFAVDFFSSPSKISINKLTQYAFCHIYYENLSEMPSGGIELLTASKKQLQEVLFKHFNLSGLKLEKSDLYNPEKKIFEMWRPSYSADIYYSASVVKKSDDFMQIAFTFFDDPGKTSVKSTVTAKIEKNSEGGYFLSEMK